MLDITHQWRIGCHFAKTNLMEMTIIIRWFYHRLPKPSALSCAAPASSYSGISPFRNSFRAGFASRPNIRAVQSVEQTT